MVFEDIIDQYDIFFVDLYGVIWSGIAAYPEALHALSTLITAGKKVVILSNASFLSNEIISKYDGEHLKKNIHFSDFVSSGDALRDVIQNSKLTFRSCQFPKTYFMVGARNDAPFAGGAYTEVDDIRSADFIYISHVQFSDDERNSMSDELKQYLYVARTNNNVRKWETTTIDPYFPVLNLFKQYNKPLVIANPDKYARCAMLPSPDATSYVSMKTVKQGLLGETYEKMGGEVFYIGKPYPQIYKYAMERMAQLLNTTFDDVKNSRIAMIGDSLNTDILGAINTSREIGCSINGILVMTGISAGEMPENIRSNGGLIHDFCKHTGVVPTHVMSALSLNATVLF